MSDPQLELPILGLAVGLIFGFAGAYSKWFRGLIFSAAAAAILYAGVATGSLDGLIAVLHELYVEALQRKTFSLGVIAGVVMALFIANHSKNPAPHRYRG